MQSNGLACALLVNSIGLGLYSIGLACTLSVWPVLYRFGLYSLGLACTLSVWPVLYRFGLYSIGLACPLSVCLILYRFASFSISLPRILYRFRPVLYRFG